MRVIHRVIHSIHNRGNVLRSILKKLGIATIVLWITFGWSDELSTNYPLLFTMVHMAVNR